MSRIWRWPLAVLLGSLLVVLLSGLMLLEAMKWAIARRPRVC